MSLSKPALRTMQAFKIVSVARGLGASARGAISSPGGGAGIFAPGSAAKIVSVARGGGIGCLGASARVAISSPGGGAGIFAPGSASKIVSVARGGIGGLGASARVAISSPGGGAGIFAPGSASKIGSVARGGLGASARVAISSPGGGAGIFAPGAAGSSRGFSSSAPKDKLKWWEPSKRTINTCNVVGAITSVIGFVSYSYIWIVTQTETRLIAYVDKKMVGFKTFQNVATDTHLQTLKKFNDAIHGMEQELSDLRSKVLALEQKEFEQRKELMLAGEIIQKYQMQMELAAEAAKDGAN